MIDAKLWHVDHYLVVFLAEKTVEVSVWVSYTA
jgi:hypothetical protein